MPPHSGHKNTTLERQCHLEQKWIQDAITSWHNLPEVMCHHSVHFSRTTNFNCYSAFKVTTILSHVYHRCKLIFTAVTDTIPARIGCEYYGRIPYHVCTLNTGCTITAADMTKKPCIGRESNPGRPRGRRAFYHWTTDANKFKKKLALKSVPCPGCQTALVLQFFV